MFSDEQKRLLYTFNANRQQTHFLMLLAEGDRAAAARSGCLSHECRKLEDAGFVERIPDEHYGPPCVRYVITAMGQHYLAIT